MRSGILIPSEVASLLGVNTKTVGRYETEGKLVAFRTLGGHRRFRLDQNPELNSLLTLNL